MSDVSSLVAAFILVVIGGILVATESALARVSKVTVEQLKKDGSKKAEILFGLLDNRAKYVNALLFAHLSLSTIAVILVTNSAIGLLGDNPQALAVAAISMVVVGYIFLGVAPQTLGRQHPERIAMRTLGLTRFVTIFLNPLSRLFISIGNAITPGKGFREGPFSTQAELRELVD
ncbi:MAG: Mg2+/Co2+ transporter, partial [Actinomycetota bacterium]